MSKEMNTELKFTTDNKIDEINYSYFCKYYLPCGRCDKSGEPCQNVAPKYPVYPSYPHYPWQWDGPYYKWWENPTCTSTKYTYTTNTTETDENLMDNKTTMKKPG